MSGPKASGEDWNIAENQAPTVFAAPAAAPGHACALAFRIADVSMGVRSDLPALMAKTA
ncbi:hypothetical protein QEV83_03730 [Methylocapsa sp. D3K7]|uniref:hypothetical protein n=1 Tax=Methylocapsa sp. D3K7 TaxID=3041435 RepID=UPI00244EBAD5|nr:hypothetical protein [Methylocapsa sp. D3K7]WGJ15403.1 hypothetical protein QEV83_03730 [Methylocapsa sp. D3K7]